MELTVINISKLSGLARKTVYKALRGGAKPSSLLKMQNAIFNITGKKIPVIDISMGLYSNSTLINSLCKKISCNKHVTINANNCCTYDDFSDTSFDISSCNTLEDFHIQL